MGHKVAAPRGTPRAAQTPSGSGEGLGLGLALAHLGGAGRLQLAAASRAGGGSGSGVLPGATLAESPAEPRRPLSRGTRALRPSSLGLSVFSRQTTGRRRPFLRGPGAAEASWGAAEGRRKEWSRRGRQ